MADTTLTWDQVEDLALQTLLRAGASGQQAASVARSTRLAERDGVRSHGLMYVPIYAEHLRCGKVLGAASPVVTRPRPSAIQVDAAHGFAHAAIDAGWSQFDAAVRDQGVAAMAVFLASDAARLVSGQVIAVDGQPIGRGGIGDVWLAAQTLYCAHKFDF